MTPQQTATGTPPTQMLATAAMEICWMASLAVHASQLVTGSDFPTLMMVTAFALASGLTVTLDVFTRVRWQLMAAHMAAFGLAVVMMEWACRHFWAIDFTRGWQGGLRWGILSALPEAGARWPAFVFLGAWALLFWWSGAVWVRRPKSHWRVCNRFDLGAALLSLLLFLRLALSSRLDITAPPQASTYLLAAFFTCGLFAIGSAKNHARPQRKHGGGRNNSKLLPVFAFGVLVVGLCLAALFFSTLENSAHMAFEAIRSTAAPLGSWLARGVTLLLNSAPDRGDRSRENTGQVSAETPPVESIVPQHDALMHGAAIFYGIIFLLLSTFAIWLAYRWLSAPTRRRDRLTGMSAAVWIDRLLDLMCYLTAALSGAMKGRRDVEDFYAALIRWAGRSGMAIRTSETPREFAVRLAERFPAIGDATGEIAEHYNGCIYGGRPFNASMRVKLRRAIYHLRSPKHWPVRLTSWFTRG